MASMHKAPLRLHVDCSRRVGPVGGAGCHRRRCVAMKANFNTVKGNNRVNGIIQIDGIEKRNGGDAVANREYLLGGFAEDRFVYRQSFVIRSYEIGLDKTATMETLMNLLQVHSLFSLVFLFELEFEINYLCAGDSSESSTLR